MMIDLTITEALAKLKSGEISATELTRAYLARIEKYGKELNCYITLTPERALADAAASDARYAAGNPLPLDGIPIGMKDLFATRGIRTTAASRMLENFIPEYESTVSQKFIDSGTVLLGKTNLDEFAMGTFSKTSFFGAPVNPYQMERKLTAGGSSGGATSAIAGGLAIGGTGTDTGGSIRFPAAITGLVGMKPTYGLCSRWGCVAFASSLDTPGPIARTVDDAALLLSAMAGHDDKDSTSANAGFHIENGLQNIGLNKLRVGIIKELANVEISADMKKLFDARVADFKAAGAEIVEISIPNILDALAAYYVIAPAEASSNLARYDGMRYGLRVEGADLIDTYKKTRAAGFGEEVQRRMVVGTAVLSSESYEVYFMQAARVRRLIADAFGRAFGQCDLIVCPSGAGPALPLDSDLTPLEYYALDLFTVAMNLAGVPACNVPCGRASNGLPLGMQVVGNKFDDMRVLQLAKHIEGFAGLDNRPTKVMGR
ncbi:MAG: Asp-tRNA(Asn)/Glu-tRNA(Gln) amidotransferase subunit GatA [Rickettsiales bacterium]|jgi:aspartyl-tRNA(Asn)/glutamyl-tRNA(Gln) amidotransferase subunit A|nr:Asp-tRNA(Asn)/Glu-tRNA(Gln) amidotransferase subunit GatA [Rickettsiales bacterium]